MTYYPHISVDMYCMILKSKYDTDNYNRAKRSIYKNIIKGKDGIREDGLMQEFI